MKTLSADQLTRYVGIRVRNPAAADRYWARCMGQDSAIDDESVARIKQFLSGKLSHEDHAKVCSMMDGGDAAEDDLPEPVAGGPIPKRTPGEKALASDAASFARMYPDAARTKLDNSGIPVPPRKSANLKMSTASIAALCCKSQ